MTRTPIEKGAYKLVSRKVPPDAMLLDPNNPRLRTDDFQTHVSEPKVISSDLVQQSLLTRICSEEHAVGPLIVSIRNQGFIELDAMLAKRLPGTDKFLILEGNRRTAAIKKLLASQQELTEAVRASLQKISIKEIICADPAQEQAVIDSIVALRHISGPKDWRPMQRAYAVYSAYRRRYKEKYGRSALAYSAKVTQEVAFMLAQEAAKVREEVSIFSVFDLLQNAGYSVRSDHYSLIQLLVSKPRLAIEYFDFNRQSLKMSSVGLERFNGLCIDVGCPIQNPKGFRGFYRIFQDGNPSDLRLVEERVRSIEMVLNDINDRKKDERFLDQTKEILKDLKGIKISAFRETDEEAQLIFQIKALVDRRLWPLAAEVLNIGTD